MNAAKDTSDRLLANAKTTMLKLNKELMKYKLMAETNKTSLEKTKKEMEAIKSKKASAIEKEINQLKEANKSANLELNATKNRVENLSSMLKKHKKNHMELNAKLLEANAKEQEAKVALKKEHERHQKLIKVHEALKNAAKDVQDQNPELSKTATEASKPNEVAEPKQSQTDQSTGDISSKGEKAVPVIPKVPSEGFKFAPSNAVPDKKAKDINDVPKKDTVKPSTAKTSSKGLLAGAPVKPKDAVDDKASKATTPSVQSLVTESSVSSEQALAKDSKGLTQKKHVKTAMKSVTPAKSKVQGTTKDKPHSATKITNDSSTSTGQNKTEQALALREKLMKRKRQLAKQLEAKNSVKKAAVASTSDTPVALPKKVPTSTNEKQIVESAKASCDVEKEVSVLPPASNNSEATSTEKSGSNKIIVLTKSVKKEEKLSGNTTTGGIDNEKTDAMKEANIQNNSAKEAIAAEESQNEEAQGIISVSENKSIETGKTKDGDQWQPPPNPFSSSFGSGKPMTFSSFSGLNATAKPFAPSFGDKNTESSNQSTSGSAFLNLKPPGSGQSAPLIFGASTKIQLPTPSKPSNATQAGIFGSANPFGSTTTFGGSFTQQSKKRSLEVDDQTTAADESAKKQTRTEGDQEKEETKTNIEVIEGDEKNNEKRVES